VLTRWRIPRLAALYAILAGLWIFLSDKVVAFLTTDPVGLTHLQTIKGWGFVVFTAGLLALILRHEARARDARDRALRDSEETYRTLFEVETDALVLIDNATGQLLAGNPAAAQLYGYPQQELLGLRNTDLSAEPAETARVTTGTAIAPEVTIRIPLRYHKKRDGTVFPVEITGRFFTWRGRPVHLAAIRDISQRRLAESTLTRYQLLAEQARDIVLFVRRDGQVLEANQAAVQAYGYPLVELVRLHIQALRAPETQSLTAEQLVQADAHGILFETVHQRKDGTMFPVEVSCRGADIAGERVLLSIIRDITDRKQAEHALATRSRQLEAVQAITAEITRELDLTRLLHLLIARAAELVGAASATLYLWSPEEGLVVPAAWHGLGDWQADLRHPLGQGIAGTVAQTRQSVLANDYRTSRYANPVSLQRTAVTASLGEPLLYREELIGAITLNHETGRTFTSQDQTLLRLFADQAAIAIANARLFRAEHDRRAQLEAVRAVSAEITEELHLAKVLHLVARRACELTRGSAADIDLWDPDRQVLVAEASYGHTAPRPATIRHLGEGAMGTVAQTRRGIILNNYRTSPIAHPETVAHTTITASLVEPLLYRDTLLGVIGVDHEIRGRTFTSQDQDVLGLFADQAAIAIANARLYGDAERRQREAEVLASLAQTITASLDLDTVLQRVTEGAKGLCDGDLASIALREGDSLSFRTWVGTVTATYPTLRIRAGQGMGGRVLVEGRPVRTADYRNDPAISAEFHAVAQNEGLQAELAVPICSAGAVAGVLFVMRRTARAFTDADEVVLTRLADQAAIAMANARLFQDQQQAYVALQQAQDELVRAEKLRGLGQMAAGIAHDLNNMLATILGQTELLRLRVRHPDVDEGLQILQTAANDGAQVVRRLQDFARQRGGGPLSSCDLIQLVPEALEITRPRWREEPRRKGITIEAAVDLPGLPPIQGNPAEIREVLTNLIFNAVDAMPKGGSLRFTARVREADEQPEAWLPGVSPARGAIPRDPAARWVELAVADTGVGMTDEVRRRIFDPFFTTKGLHGTGLGLSVVYGIMERHGGQIDVTSAPGQGSTFRLRFRLASTDGEWPAPPPIPKVVSSRRILLIDDDPGVRATLASLLRARGLVVIEAEGGAAGLAQLETTPVDLVLTDLGMPEITGWDVARAAKSRHASLPVVLLTGWGEQVEAEAPLDACVDRVLGKPAPLSELLAVIVELTGER
jgi:PAS domain S-box-containing protein